VAVKLTDCPRAAKVGFEVTVVVVGCPVEGVMSTHQPPVAVVVVGPDSLEMYRDHAPCAVAPTNDVRKLLLPTGGAVEKLPGNCGAGGGGPGVNASEGGLLSALHEVGPKVPGVSVDAHGNCAEPSTIV
jgi:hypothetical protein